MAKRSGSMSRIPRSSSGTRLTLTGSKNPTSNAAPVRPNRTSQLRRSKSSTNLQVPGNFRRSNSNTNLYSTPVNTVRRTTKSPLTCPRQRSDKRQQIVEFNKVKEFILERDPNVGSLCPPSVVTFIAAFNILFKEIDPRITIKKQDFHEKIPFYLKSFKYPGTISKSSFKTVSAMHTFPTFVMIWTWLLELIEKIKDLESSLCALEPDMKKNMFRQMITEYNHNNYSSEGKDYEQRNDEFKKQLVEIKGLDISLIEKKRKENEELAEKYQIVSSKCETCDAEIMEYNKNINFFTKSTDEIQKNNDMFHEQFKEKKERLLHDEANIDTQLTRNRNNIQKLKEQVLNQPCTSSERKEMLNKIKELTHTHKLKHDRNQDLRDIISLKDSKIQDLKQSVEEKIFSINTFRSRLALEIPELKNVVIREKGLHNPEVLQDIKQAIEKMNDIKTNFAAKLLTDKEQIKVIENEINEIGSCNLNVEQTILKLQRERDELAIQKEELKREKNKELVMLQNAVEQKTNELKEIIGNTKDLEIYKQKLEMLNNVSKCAKEELVDFQKNALLSTLQYCKEKETFETYDAILRDILAALLIKHANDSENLAKITEK